LLKASGNCKQEKKHKPRIIINVRVKDDRMKYAVQFFNQKNGKYVLDAKK
jgi:hypothetical protein